MRRSCGCEHVLYNSKCKKTIVLEKTSEREEPSKATDNSSRRADEKDEKKNLELARDSTSLPQYFFGNYHEIGRHEGPAVSVKELMTEPYISPS